jgi:hypothetical protein
MQLPSRTPELGYTFTSTRGSATGTRIISYVNVLSRNTASSRTVVQTMSKEDGEVPEFGTPEREAWMACLSEAIYRSKLKRTIGHRREQSCSRGRHLRRCSGFG